jgi:hypothetical protein
MCLRVDYENVIQEERAAVKQPEENTFQLQAKSYVR